MMKKVGRQFVALESPMGRRNGAGFHPCQGLYSTPVGERPKTAFIASHYNVDFSEHYLGEYMASRGYGFLGWNTRFRGNEAFFLLEYALMDIGAGIRWLREVAGVETIVLLGNSGGGSLMAAYQSSADTGVFPGDAKNIYDLIGSTDKQLEMTEGDHYLTTPDDARDRHADLIAGWLNKQGV